MNRVIQIISIVSQNMLVSCKSGVHSISHILAIAYARLFLPRFTSENGLSVDLRSISKSEDPISAPEWNLVDGGLGPAAQTQFEIQEGQCIAFIFREAPTKASVTAAATRPRVKRHGKSSSRIIYEDAFLSIDPVLSWPLVLALKTQTFEYWTGWIRKSNCMHCLRRRKTLHLT